RHLHGHPEGSGETDQRRRCPRGEVMLLDEKGGEESPPFLRLRLTGGPHFLPNVAKSELRSAGAARSAVRIAAFWRDTMSAMPLRESSSIAFISSAVKTASSPLP